MARLLSWLMRCVLSIWRNWFVSSFSQPLLRPLGGALEVLLAF